jgi:transcriptional regulator with XRE-family HTH domain
MTSSDPMTPLTKREIDMVNYWKTQTSDPNIKKQIDRWMKLFADKETRHGYVDGFLDSFLGMQIRVLRESRKLTQTELGEAADMHQARISLLESMNYSDWSLDVLRRLAKAFDLRLVVRFEDFGSFIREYFEDFDREHLQRRSFDADPVFSKKVRSKVQSGSNSVLAGSPKHTEETMQPELRFLKDKAVISPFSPPQAQSTTRAINFVRDLSGPMPISLTAVN